MSGLNVSISPTKKPQNHKNNSRLLTYKKLKDEKKGKNLMPQFQQLKRSDLRQNKVTGFMKTSEFSNLHEQERLIENEGAKEH